MATPKRLFFILATALACAACSHSSPSVPDSGQPDSGPPPDAGQQPIPAGVIDCIRPPSAPAGSTRGRYALRLDPGTGAIASATSAAIPAAPSMAYVLTGNFRFAFSGDPQPSAAPAQRPQVRVTLSSWTAAGLPASGAPAVFRFFQEDSTSGFATFPLAFTTPADADALRIELAALRNGLPGALVADFDALR